MMMRMLLADQNKADQSLGLFLPVDFNGEKERRGTGDNRDLPFANQ